MQKTTQKSEILQIPVPKNKRNEIVGGKKIQKLFIN